VSAADLPAPVLAVCGWSGSGKTTLLETVLPRLTAAGLRVAALKHDGHGVEVDRPGKDSDRLFRAGADVLLRAPGETFARWHGLSLAGALDLLAAEHDLVFVEGHKDTPLPKVWLATATDESPPDGLTDLRGVLPWDGARVEALERLATGLARDHHMARPRLAGVLLGGGSARMGRTKHLLEHGGATFVERVVAAASPHAAEVVLLGSGEVPRSLAASRRLPDPPGLDGPIAGLLAALRWAPAATWVVLASDLPLLDAEAVAWLLSCRRPGVRAVLPLDAAGRPEPLFAAWEPQARPLLERIAAAGGGPVAAAGEPGVATPPAPAAIARLLRNVNTPDELASLGEGPAGG
jgi:molybdopterin-guanine dinucleotide biosynthesis protein MobB